MSAPFATLCDLVASDRLVWMTGAGISQGIARRKDGQPVPGWGDLLAELVDLRMSAVGLDSADEHDIRRLLDGEPPGARMVEAASLVSSGWADFDAETRRAVAPADTQSAAVSNRIDHLHDVLIDAAPRGIVTLNYDDMHERALGRRGVADDWVVLVPGAASADSQLARSLTEGLRTPFLLKAHGCIHESGGPLVLSYDTYRTLLAKHPAYRAFVQNILTNFSLVMLGFGMSDPDFDLFFDAIAAQFGSPLQRHVVITKLPDDAEKRREAEAREVLLRRRWGVETLRVDEWSEIPGLLREALVTTGPELQDILVQCLSTSHQDRRTGHRRLRQLGAPGRAVAIRWLLDAVATHTGPDVHRQSELVYTLGVPEPPDEQLRALVREALFRVVENEDHPEPVAHAIDRLDAYVELSDSDRLQRCRAALARRHFVDDARFPGPERILAYMDRLLLRLAAASHIDVPASA